MSQHKRTTTHKDVLRKRVQARRHVKPASKFKGRYIDMAQVLFTWDKSETPDTTGQVLTFAISDYNNQPEPVKLDSNATEYLLNVPGGGRTVTAKHVVVKGSLYSEPVVVEVVVPADKPAKVKNFKGEVRNS